MFQKVAQQMDMRLLSFFFVELFWTSPIPVEHQKIMLGGIAQMMVGDKRGNVEFDKCGYTSGSGLAVMTIEQGAKPHIPRPSPNRLDNLGNMSEGWSPAIAKAQQVRLGAGRSYAYFSSVGRA